VAVQVFLAMRSLDRHSRRKAGLTTPHKPLKEKPKVKKAAKTKKKKRG
jgi:hypothetical protein